MSFIRHKGKTKLMYFKGDTALEVRAGGLVGLTDSGTLTPATNDSLDRVVGVARRSDTVTDSALVPVEVPVESAVEWTIDVDSDGGAADSDVGRYIAVDTAGGASVNAGDSAGTRVDMSDTSSPQVFVTGRISASKIRGVLSRTAFTRTFDTLDTSG
jgi:hypothetical protein